MTDLFNSPHITGALYFTDQGHYLFKYKETNMWQSHTEENHVITKSIREPEVAAAFSHKGSDSGYLQEGVIRVGNNSKGAWFVFIRKPAKCNIEVAGTGKLTVPAPLLVFIAAEGLFYVFALAKKEFSPEAIAYNAPFPNVNSTGWICWGTENGNPKVAPNKANQVVDLFFKSPFNNDLNNGKSKKFPDDIKGQLAMINGLDKYPTKDLVATHYTIGRIIEDHIQERR